MFEELRVYEVMRFLPIFISYFFILLFSHTATPRERGRVCYLFSLTLRFFTLLYFTLLFTF